MAVKLSELILYCFEGQYVAEGRDPEGTRLPEKLSAVGISHVAKKVILAGWEIDRSRIQYSTESARYNPRTGLYKDAVRNRDLKEFDEWYLKHKELLQAEETDPRMSKIVIRTVN